MAKQVTIGIADMKIARLEGILITYALGSCVGVCLYDPVIKLGGLVHIMLPEAGTMDRTNVFKYADTGIAETIRKMEVFGAMRRRMVGKIAGGAKMFDMQDNATFGNIGLRNIDSVKNKLKIEGIRLIAQDVGANYARTLSFDVTNGEAKVRTFGRTEVIL